MKRTTPCYCLVLLALAIFSPSVCYPQGDERVFSEARETENGEMWEMQTEAQKNPYDTDQEYDVNQQLQENENEADVQGSLCISEVHVMGFTSGLKYAGSDNSPFIEIDLCNHEEKRVRFPDNPGNDMVRNKGDLWTIPISRFGFKKTKCIRRRDIRKVAVEDGGNDGWNIQSIVTMARTKGNRYLLLSVTMNVNRWVDGNGNSVSQQQFPLFTKQC